NLDGRPGRQHGAGGAGEESQDGEDDLEDAHDGSFRGQPIESASMSSRKAVRPSTEIRPASTMRRTNSGRSFGARRSTSPPAFANSEAIELRSVAARANRRAASLAGLRGGRSSGVSSSSPPYPFGAPFASPLLSPFFGLPMIHGFGGFGSGTRSTVVEARSGLCAGGSTGASALRLMTRQSFTA